MNELLRQPTFDRCGLASLAELSTARWEELFGELDGIQAEFLRNESAFRSDDYPWPRDALRNWSRVWEYPYVHHHVRREAQRAGRRLRIVDVGSGVTFFPFATARAGHEVLCVDNDPRCVEGMEKAIAVTDAGAGSVRTELSDGKNVPVEDGWADVVISVSVIEHVADRRALVSSMSRALASHGLCVLTIDLDLRGDHEIDPQGRHEILDELERRFDYDAPFGFPHPREILLSTNGPYGFAMPAAGPLLRFRIKQFVQQLRGQEPKPLYPFELAVEGLVLRKR